MLGRIDCQDAPPPSAPPADMFPHLAGYEDVQFGEQTLMIKVSKLKIEIFGVLVILENLSVLDLALSVLKGLSYF